MPLAVLSFGALIDEFGAPATVAIGGGIGDGHIANRRDTSGVMA